MSEQKEGTLTLSGSSEAESKAPEADRTVEREPSRDDSTRQAEARPSDSFVPASTLPVPNPRDGIVHRWVRTGTLGASDNSNVSMRFREGWSPVKIKDYPELNAQVDIDSRFTDGVEIGGLVLCSAPVEIMEKRKKYYADQAARQVESTDKNFFREQDPRMPTLSSEGSSRTEFRKGS